LDSAHNDALRFNSVLIHSPPQIVTVALDRQKYFIPLLLLTRPRTAATQLIRIPLAKLATPFPNRFIRHPYATFTQEIFNIAEA
jgi:hypothetical protein